MGVSEFWAGPAFAAGDSDFSWLDVVLGAMVAGTWSSFERRLAENLAVAARARAEDVTPGEDQVEAAATEFRYERDLIAGAELGDWLDWYHLTTADWLSYFSRDLLRQHYADELDDTIDRFPPSARQLHEAAIAEGVCSGRFDEFHLSFSRHVALALAADEAILRRAEDDGVASEARRLAHQHSHWLEGLDAVDVHRRLVVALHVEQAFTSIADTLTTPDALRSLLEARQMDWTRLTIQSLDFSTAHAAREAILCVKIDGLSLDDVGMLARQPVQRTRVFLEDLPAEQRLAFLGADTGQVVGPLQFDDRFQVAVVVEHSPPSLDDAHVEERARRAAVAESAARAASLHVARARG